jgi:uncharacterized protein
MNPANVLSRYYNENSDTYRILLEHGHCVAEKALAAAAMVYRCQPDRTFIKEACFLHDIGIFLTRSPSLGCHGVHPYIRHGHLGRQLLEAEGLNRHARVCERHVGAGISKTDIRDQGLTLPERDMRPVTLEEEIICYADKFFSKSIRGNGSEKPLPQILNTLSKYGEDKVKRFLYWHDRFTNG